jgi:hypothetical protein
MKLSKLFSLVNLIRRLPVDELLQFPRDFKDLEQVKPWVQAVAETLQVLAEYTDSKLDDKAVGYVVSALENPDVWSAVQVIYGMIQGRRQLKAAA